MIRKSGVPPDSGVDIFGQIHALLIRARFAHGAVEVHQIRIRNHHRRRFRLPRVQVDRVLLHRAARRRLMPPLHVNHIIVSLLQLCLRKIRQQVFVPAMPIYDDDFLTAVARHLVGRFLQELQLQLGAVGHRARFMPGLEDLPEIILRKYHRVFLFRRVQRRVAYIQQIGPQRQMRSMFFQNAERQQAGAVRFPDGLAEIGRRQFFPLGRALGLGLGRS